jgi:acetate kinase
MQSILVVNAGSSSLKFQAFRPGPAKGLDRLARGQIDGIGLHPRLVASLAGQPATAQDFVAAAVPDTDAALAEALRWLASAGVDPVAVGHRVVHGGPRFAVPVQVTPAILAELEALTALAPLHQPGNLAPIRMFLQTRPELPQVACFDTAFHRGHPALADIYAIPARFHDIGIRRYGFHGLSYEFILNRLREVAPQLAQARVIVAHLGSGASICAIAGGQSMECSMGFSTLDGLPMGTRPGEIDPGVLLHLMMQKNMTATELQDLLYRDSGLKGLSGVSSDVRDLEASDDPSAGFALDYFAYRTAMQVAAMTASLGGLEGVIFTAGIGENAAGLRSRICQRLAWLGIALDDAANARHDMTISASGSLPVLVVPTDEELMIARHTQDVISRSRP